LRGWYLCRLLKKAAETMKPGDPTVGRYVVRNDDSNWVANANEFWGGLTTFFGGAFFTDSQYYWAYPFEFSTNEASPDGVVKTGLPMCPPEKKARKLALGVRHDTFSCPV
jgi:hypothetical protein